MATTKSRQLRHCTEDTATHSNNTSTAASLSARHDDAQDGSVTAASAQLKACWGWVNHANIKQNNTRRTSVPPRYTAITYGSMCTLQCYMPLHSAQDYLAHPHTRETCPLSNKPPQNQRSTSLPCSWHSWGCLQHNVFVQAGHISQWLAAAADIASPRDSCRASQQLTEGVL